MSCSSFLSPSSPLVLLPKSNKKKARYKLRDDASSTSTENETSEHQDSSPPPSQRLIKKNKVISLIEEEKDLAKFRFHYVKNGIKKLKNKKQHIADRLHYKCNQHDKRMYSAQPCTKSPCLCQTQVASAFSFSKSKTTSTTTIFQLC